jgi:hypothetical protein
MSRNGAGVYTAPASSFPAVANTLIESTKFNNIVNDISTALTGSLAANGETTVTANIPMASHKLTGLSAGTNPGDSVRYDEYLVAITPVAGQVLQMVTATDAGSNTTATTATNLNAAVVTITPKSTSSKLLISCQFAGSSGKLAATNITSTFQIYETSETNVIGYGNNLETPTGGGGTNIATPCTVSAIVTNSSTSARTFGLSGKNSSVPTTGLAAAGMVWSITEIKV